MSFQIEEVVLRLVKLPQKEPFVTSGWVTDGKTPIIVEIRGGGVSGFGESAVPLFPFYNHETPRTVLHILKDFAIPIMTRTKPETPEALAMALKQIVGNPFARAGLEMAFWDWHAKRKGMPLYKMLGGKRSEIQVGVSIGLQKDEAQLLSKVQGYVDRGYQRIKLKIAPGKDLRLVQAIMESFPDIPLMVDANSAYTYRDAHIFHDMDRFKLMMIEQPFRDGDLFDHSKLQAELKNAICLDESIICLEDAQAALAMESCRIINIKPGRVAGLFEARRIHDMCHKEHIPVWCGGMLETGIGRAANMALATLPGFTLPGDISESGRYYHEDIVSPVIELKSGGTLQLMDSPGIGFEVDQKSLDRFTIEQEKISIPK